MSATKEEMIPISEAARLTNFPESTLRRWAAKGKIEGLKRERTGAYLIPESALAGLSAIATAREFDRKEARALRLAMGLSLAQAGVLLGIDKPMMWHLEHDRTPTGTLALDYQALRMQWADELAKKEEGPE